MISWIVKHIPSKVLAYVWPWLVGRVITRLEQLLIVAQDKARATDNEIDDRVVVELQKMLGYLRETVVPLVKK